GSPDGVSPAVTEVGATDPAEGTAPISAATGSRGPSGPHPAGSGGSWSNTSTSPSTRSAVVSSRRPVAVRAARAPAAVAGRRAGSNSVSLRTTSPSPAGSPSGSAGAVTVPVPGRSPVSISTAHIPTAYRSARGSGSHPASRLSGARYPSVPSATGPWVSRGASR